MTTESLPTRQQIDDMNDTELKIYENRLRRMAKRQNLKLQKSRSRDPRAADYGTYMLTTESGGIEASGQQAGYGLDLYEIHISLLGATIHVDFSAPHEPTALTFADTNDEPILHYRNGDGWVLATADGDEELTGVTSLDPQAALDEIQTRR